MLSRISPIVARTVATRSIAPVTVRSFTSVGVTTAAEAAKLSGYSNIDFRIQEDAMVIDAVQQFAANNIGCLVTINTSGMYQNILLRGVGIGISSMVINRHDLQ